ncbi:MAG: BolA family transcriptional regulator [bacterium]|nr:BolA family transcriptional regulator [bacterium]
MSLKILGDDSPDVIAQIRSAIEDAIECQDLTIESGSPGHFAIRVVSNAFADLGRVKQQQLVYTAIAHLMQGEAAPIHAVDKLECIPPGQ